MTFQPESAMLVQEYLPEMTPSQLFVTYAGGLSTVGGVSLVIFMSSGVCLCKQLYHLGYFESHQNDLNLQKLQTVSV